MGPQGQAVQTLKVPHLGVLDLLCGHRPVWKDQRMKICDPVTHRSCFGR